MSLLSFVMPRMFGENFEGIKMLFSNYSKMVRFLLFCVFHSFISLSFNNFRKEEETMAMIWLMMTADSIDCLLPSNELLTNWGKADNNIVINNNDSYYFDKRPIETHQSHLES